MTKEYLILIEYPVSLNLNILFSETILNSLFWENRNTTVYVIHIETRKVSTLTTIPFFSFHHINAYEYEQSIIVDAIVYPNVSCFQSLTLDSLRKGDGYPNGVFQRLIITNEIKLYRPNFPPFEMPQIHPEYEYKKYDYWYGMGTQGKHGIPLVQGRISTETVKYWEEPGQYPSEPVFVATGTTETSGVLLSVVYESIQNRSYLLFVDTDMKTVAKAFLNISIPFTCHGHYEKA